MPTRRSILRSAAALSAAPLAPRAVFGRVATQAANLRVICDSRHAESRAFGRHARRLGASTRTIAGDITDLWQTELRTRWRAAPTVVAGLTERPALFLLEHLGWEHGMRVIYQAEHETRPDRTVHRVGRSADPYLDRELERAGRLWPSALAELILGAPRAIVSSDVSPSGAAMAARLGEPTMLYSWIIAPRPNA